MPAPGEDGTITEFTEEIRGYREYDLWRRRLRHDIRHELGTIIMLASAIAVSDDVGPASRTRIQQLLGETSWLDHLLRQLEDDEDPVPSPERVPVHELASGIVSGIRLSTGLQVGYEAEPAWAHISELALWRALRNLLDNACKAAEGRVDVRVTAHDGRVVIQVDDDGPGFSPGPAGLGLGIVHDLVSAYDGTLEIWHGDLGGACVRIMLPGASS
jgi:signal transduction histidine kinase